jgi:DNA polymerase/3'-5' exonuclease PolX
MNAVKHLRRCTHAVKSKEDALNVTGIGEAMASHIDEFLKTGDVKHFEECRARLP